MTRDRGVPAVIALVVTGVAARLIQLNWLHPLSVDEREFFVAARWIGEGRLPYRDFWEHHTPLMWFVFAPFTKLTASPGAGAVLLMRWLQVPVWIATFLLANLWMRNAGLSRFARWSSIALVAFSTLFMLPAIEFRIDALGCLLFVAAMVLMQRAGARSAAAAGVLFCLAGFANVRLGPVIVIAALLYRVCLPTPPDSPAHARDDMRSRANRIFIGAAATLAAALLFFAGTQSLRQFVLGVFRDTYVGDKYAAPIPGGFAQRMLVPFGIHVTDVERWSPAIVDAGGAAIIVLGFLGLVLALKQWRRPDDRFIAAAIQLANVFFIASMKFIHNYHFALFAILMLPLAAIAIERIPRRAVVFAMLGLAWCSNLSGSLFRGKELDLAYQDLILREVYARTRPGEKVWSGMVFTTRREPAYRLWLLPHITHNLVHRGLQPPYAMADVLRDPPGALVVDQFAIGWMAGVQRELGAYFVRHYFPVWRNLWIPAPNVLLEPRGSFRWIVPRDGGYQVYASAGLAKHLWFRKPLYSVQLADATWLELPLPAAAHDPRLHWSVDGQPVTVGSNVTLRRGQSLAVTSDAEEELAIILLPANDRTLFREPPPNVTIEAGAPRVTHVPDFHARIR